MYTRFKPPHAKPGPIHERLFKLHPPLILTTNYDTLLEDAYSQAFGGRIEVYTFKDAPQVEWFLKSQGQSIERPLIFKIHGCVTRPAETVIAKMDYRGLRYRHPGYRIVLSAIFVTKVVLMLGFSFSDPEILVLTESLRESLKRRSSPDYIVLPKGEKGAIQTKRLRDDFGLQVIEYEPSGNHRELLELVDYLVEFVPPRGDSAASRTSSEAESEMKIWSDVEYVYRCLADLMRTSAFESAIRAVVKPGDVVLDLGTGSGIMSIFAARAGAGRVFAVEIGPHLDRISRAAFNASGFGSTIVSLCVDVRQITRTDVGEPDVVICEMMTTGSWARCRARS